METHFFSVFCNSDHETHGKLMALGGRILLSTAEAENDVFSRKIQNKKKIAGRSPAKIKKNELFQCCFWYNLMQFRKFAAFAALPNQGTEML